jgi:hypothetical protein
MMSVRIDNAIGAWVFTAPAKIIRPSHADGLWSGYIIFGHGLNSRFRASPQAFALPSRESAPALRVSLYPGRIMPSGR